MTMILEAAARRLSIAELFHVLDEKLSEECSRSRSFMLSAAALESEVRLYYVAGMERSNQIIYQIDNLETRAQDIQKLLNSLRDILRGVLRPVNRLPPELISYIAQYVPEEEEVDARSIVQLTHVCRFWRDSIISTPELWTLISSGRMKLAKLCLERAKTVPLTVHLDFGGIKGKRGSINLLSSHFKNTASFTCINFSKIEELAQVLNFPKSLPNLRSLSLTRPRDTIQVNHTDLFDFSAHTALRELSLYNIPFVPSILSLRTLTKFSIFNYGFELPIDTLLGLLDANRSLESASLTMGFAEPSLCHTYRKTPVGRNLRHLSISSDDPRTLRAFISNIALRAGGNLDIRHTGNNAGLTGVLSGVSTECLPGLSSPVFMKYRPFPRSIQLLGPGGSFSYEGLVNTEGPFGEFPLLPLTGIRELHLEGRGSWILRQFRLSCFPSLEVLAVDGSSKVSLLTPVLPDPASSPSLKTVAFLDCVITDDFMAQLAQVALDRKNASAPLNRVVIMNSGGEFPAAASVERLRGCVSVVEVLGGREFPKDLSWNTKGL